MIKNISPVVKWSGSKRSQADKIVETMPEKIKTYYEPFLGGGSIFIKLATDEKRNVNKFILSDINDDLINLWNLVKKDHFSVFQNYNTMWNEMVNIKSWDKKKNYYNSVRLRFNEEKSPFDFMFIMRTCFNGMVRYDKNSYFNTSLHPNRNGIEPKKLLLVLKYWSSVINNNDVEFLSSSYEHISSKENDFIYLDPPYASSKGMYYGSLSDYDKLWNFLRNQKAKWLLSFDGTTTTKDYIYEVPKDLYSTHKFLESGNSSFRRLKGKTEEYVSESLYGNY